jgi:hypothetical protein
MKATEHCTCMASNPNKQGETTCDLSIKPEKSYKSGSEEISVGYTAL